MAQGNFRTALDFTMLPANDGQPCHVDSGGATSWRDARYVVTLDQAASVR